jgi:hypothetical protein
VSILHYSVGQHDVASMEKSLVDRGDNGGICGEDMRVLEGSDRFVDASGLVGHKNSHCVLSLHRNWYQLTREMLLPRSIKWHCLVRVKVFSRVSK